MRAERTCCGLFLAASGLGFWACVRTGSQSSLSLVILYPHSLPRSLHSIVWFFSRGQTEEPVTCRPGFKFDFIGVSSFFFPSAFRCWPVLVLEGGLLDSRWSICRLSPSGSSAPSASCLFRLSFDCQVLPGGHIVCGCWRLKVVSEASSLSPAIFGPPPSQQTNQPRLFFF